MTARLAEVARGEADAARQSHASFQALRRAEQAVRRSCARQAAAARRAGEVRAGGAYR
jgi:hypothetical protein